MGIRRRLERAEKASSDVTAPTDERQAFICKELDEYLEKFSAEFGEHCEAPSSRRTIVRDRPSKKPGGEADDPYAVKSPEVRRALDEYFATFHTGPTDR